MLSKDRLLCETGKDGFAVHEGMLRSGAVVGAKVIPRSAMEDDLHGIADIEKLAKLGASREMHFFTRYLEVVDAADKLIIALETDDFRNEPFGGRRKNRMGRT